MNAIKTLLAVSVLATAGAANAAIFNITIDGSSTQFPSPVTNAVIHDTGTYDSTAGTGNVHGTIAVTVGSVFTLTESNVVTMNTATGKGKYFAGTGCTDDAPGASNGQLCAGLSGAFQGNLTSTTPVTGAGTYEWDMKVVFIDSNTGDPSSFIVPYTVTLTTPAAVPVPAAAWLFGSGLLGLAGTARRRRTA